MGLMDLIRGGDDKVARRTFPAKKDEAKMLIDRELDRASTTTTHNPLMVLIPLLVVAVIAIAILIPLVKVMTETPVPVGAATCDDECLCQNGCKSLNLTFSKYLGHGVPHLRKCYCNLADGSENEIWKGHGASVAPNAAGTNLTTELIDAQMVTVPIMETLTSFIPLMVALVIIMFLLANFRQVAGMVI